jgi:hypothetical protein
VPPADEPYSLPSFPVLPFQVAYSLLFQIVCWFAYISTSIVPGRAKRVNSRESVAARAAA